jgi:hypothetical protein
LRGMVEVRVLGWVPAHPLSHLNWKFYRHRISGNLCSKHQVEILTFHND